MLTRAVIFDFGGVLLTTVDETARQRWAKRLDLDPVAMEAQIFESELMERAMIGEVSVDEMWRGVGEMLGLDAEQSQALQTDFFQGDRLNEELLAFARSLEPHYKMAILSNAWDNAREVFTDLFGLDEVFETMIISAEVGLAKPDPRIYHLALERIGVQAGEAVFLDDMRENVVAARDVGLRAVLYQDNRQAIADVQAQLGLA
jgi:epoxide hydrolase-like predicted phosphatase